MKKNWTDFVRDRMNEKNLKQEDIAEALDKTQGTIGHWLTGRRSPNFTDVANILKITGTNQVILNSDGTIEDEKSNVIKVNNISKYSYPILSCIEAGTLTETFDYGDSTGYEFLETDIEASAGSFFLKISGQSMEPKFSEGDIVLIDPKRYPHPGQFVAAINGKGEATFKRYKELGELSEASGKPHFELEPLNPVYGTISSLTQDIRIIGVAVEHRTYL